MNFQLSALSPYAHLVNGSQTVLNMTLTAPCTLRGAAIAPPGLCTAVRCTKTCAAAANSDRVPTGGSAGELLRERLCLGRFRGGEYCLPRNALFPLLRLRLGLQLLESFLLGMCRLLSARSWLPLPFLSLFLDLLLRSRSARVLLRSFPKVASSCLPGDLVLASALSLLDIAESRCCLMAFNA